MSEYTPITTELRLSLGFFNGLTDFERDKFVQLCDAIDAVHAHLEQNYADAISALDLALREHDNYVQLPIDANGEVIHLGDDMETLDERHKGEHCVVEYMALTYDGWEVDGEPSSTLIHHIADTWESVIYDAMQAGRTDATMDVTPLIERCKALAGEDR